MKTFKLILFTLLLIGSQLSFAQHDAEGGCSSVTVLNNPASFSNNLFIGGGWQFISPCFRILSSGNPVAQPRHFLQRLNANGTSWTTVQGPITSGNQFNGLSKGTYRVRTNIPVPVTNSSCVGPPSAGFVPIQNTNGQFIGFHGTWGSTQYYSNEVIVGKPNFSDNDFEFIDPIGFQGLYNNNEPVHIDMSQSTNYDRYHVQISMLNPSTGQYTHWNSLGWQNGPVNSVDMLEVFQNNHPSWKFWPNNEWKVTVATANSACPGGWNAKTDNFIVCPTNWNCRLAEDEEPIVLSPNPARNTFNLTNMNLNSESEYDLLVHDLAGKLVRHFTEVEEAQFDVSSLSKGMYVISLMEDGVRIYSDKLSIIK